MLQPVERIRREFDQIAPFSHDGWDHNNHFHPFLLSQLPPRIESALDVGCGTGAFARLLAARANHVLALDLSPEMIRLARERSSAQSNIEFRVADVLQTDLPAQAFDCIASIATLHHMALDVVLPKLAAALKPGGVLLVVDLYQNEGVLDLLWSALSVPAHAYYARKHHYRSGQSAASAAAWQAHGDGDVYPRVSEVRKLAAALLPGARVQKQLMWRYTLIWRKPAG